MISTPPFMKARSNGFKSEDIPKDRKGKGTIEKIKVETNRSQMKKKKNIKFVEAPQKI